ncbi:winged helix-turn-helix domain-containing protein [Amycolatopsis sp. WAC 04197]|uniref:GntR family transcriptional regulator n=1 Tax=Amycolatopsis sp. WAC 04197 TaxID=2203199 RepID=UPI001315922F|nr:winged helix-turn-helix domain-containing protein [Amycolatopsis sp. WAC 04197]
MSATLPAGHDPTTPTYKRIAADLRAQITTGALAPGKTIPSISRLAHVYGCAVATVQQAVKILRDEGYVASASGRGTFVLATHPAPGVRAIHTVNARLAALAVLIEEAQQAIDAETERRRRSTRP